jgi:hypothetical protein
VKTLLKFRFLKIVLVKGRAEIGILSRNFVLAARESGGNAPFAFYLRGQVGALNSRLETAVWLSM